MSVHFLFYLFLTSGVDKTFVLLTKILKLVEDMNYKLDIAKYVYLNLFKYCIHFFFNNAQPWIKV